MNRIHAKEMLLRTAWRIMRSTYGLFFIVAGIDKFFNFVTNWPQYYSPALLQMFNLSPHTASRMCGVIEIALGALFFIRPWVRYAAYAAIVWIGVIITHLILIRGHLDIVVRDVIIALSILAFERLTASIDYPNLPLPKSQKHD